MKSALQQVRGAFLTVAIFSGFLNLLMLAPSIYMMQVYDRVLGSRNESTLLALTVLVVGAFLFMSALEAIRTWILVRVGMKLDGSLGARVFQASFERSLANPSSNSSQPIHDLNTVRNTLTGSALLALLDAPWTPIYLLVIALFSFELGVFAISGAVLLIVLAIVNERLSKTRLDEAQRLVAQSQLALANHLRNAEVIQAMGMLGQIRRRWHALHARHLQLQASASDQAAVLSGLTRFVRITMQSLSLGLGALLVLEGTLTSGMMIAASILVGRALAPTELLVANWKQIVVGRAAYQRLRDLLATFPVPAPTMSLPAPKGALSLDGVTVAAPGTRLPILKSLRLAIQPGESVAVIGPSGSGKSTLARALVGVWPAASGTVRLDGADLVRWSREELGPHIGYLPQDIELFEGTVAENIARFGEVDSTQVVAAAQRVGMHEQVLALPQGYDSALGPGGSAISGGMRQRVGLARALYGEPTLVVLDEPNSNLDEPGERALAETLSELKKRGRTTVLITHRLSALSVVDKVLVLKDGVVVAFGPRDEVLAKLYPRQGASPAPAPGVPRVGAQA